MFKKITSLILAAALFAGSGALSQDTADNLMSAFSMSASADETVIYNGDTMTGFASRTKQSVADRYAEAYYSGASYINGDSSTYYDEAASIVSPYNAGKPSSDTLTSMKQMTDFYRWLVGNGGLTQECTYNEQLQYQALDRNFEFDHVISEKSKPADMPQEMWDKGVEIGHNILAMGTTPREAIYAWMNEGYNLSTKSWTAIGHRLILIDPQKTDQQFGYCGNVAIGKYIGNDSTASVQPFWAYPSPSYVPDNCVDPVETSWTVTVDTSRITMPASVSSLKVTITNLDTGASAVRTSANNNLIIPSGYENTIQFVQPSDYNTATRKYSGDYKVIVSGLKDASTGKAAQIEYTVRFFDVGEYAAGAAAKTEFDINEIAFCKGLYTDSESLKKIGGALPTTFTVTNDFGRTEQVSTTSVWTLDEENQCWTNTVDETSCPEYITDRNQVMSRLKIRYTIIDESNANYENLK